MLPWGTETEGPQGPSCGALSLLPPKIDKNKFNIIKEGKRNDGRLPQEVRPMHLQTLALGSASGSAFVSLGNTKVYCSVFGPRPAGRSDLQDRGFIKVDFRSSPFFQKNSAEVEECLGGISLLIHQALDGCVLLNKYPKALLDVCILVLEDDGGVLSAALTCAGLALADAGVECLDVIAGASAYAFTYKDDGGTSQQIVCLDLDATEYEVYRHLPDFTVIHIGFCPALSSICCLQCRGPLIGGPIGEQMLSLCEGVCVEIGEEVRRCLKKSFCIKDNQLNNQQQDNNYNSSSSSSFSSFSSSSAVKRSNS